MPTTYDLSVDATSEALSTSLIPSVQAAYDAGPGYPSLTVDQAYVLSNAVRVGLHYGLPPQFIQPAYPRGAPSNLPTVPKLTPTVNGVAALAVVVPDVDVAYANAIIAAIGGAALVDVLGCALCTGLAALAGNPVHVGPWIL